MFQIVPETNACSKSKWVSKRFLSTRINRWCSHSFYCYQILPRIPSGQYYKLFTPVITPLAAYFPMVLTELSRQRRNYGRKKFYNIFITLATADNATNFFSLSLKLWRNKLSRQSLTNIFSMIQAQGQFSQHFIFFITYEWAQ